MGTYSGTAPVAVAHVQTISEALDVKLGKGPTDTTVVGYSCAEGGEVVHRRLKRKLKKQLVVNANK